MATPATTLNTESRIDRLEQQLAATRLMIALSVLLNLAFVGLALNHYGFHFRDRTIEVHKVILTDPAGKPLAVLGVDNKWDDYESKTYYPGIEFRDDKGDKKMALFGTSINFAEGNARASLGFTGLEIGDESKSTKALLNTSLLSYSTKAGQLLLMPHATGLALTLQDDGDDIFGVLTESDAKSASMYVANPRWEFDINADEKGAGSRRTARGTRGR